jgi:hypothetical protein
LKGELQKQDLLRPSEVEDAPEIVVNEYLEFVQEIFSSFPGFSSI